MKREAGLRRFVRRAAGAGNPPGRSSSQPSREGQSARDAQPPAPGESTAAGQPPAAGQPRTAGTSAPQGTSAQAERSPNAHRTPLAGRFRQTGQPGEHCGLCAKPIAATHRHVADLEQSTLVCACSACYLLFARDRASGRYRAVPERYVRDPSRTISVAEWDELDIPVGIAFFLRITQRDEVCGFYPSPAGATECVLDLHAWRRLARAHPLFDAAEPDVEAILISRAGPATEYFLVPIDACYELAGRMRLHWRGFDGGSEARASIEEFLADVRERASLFTGPAGERSDG